MFAPATSLLLVHSRLSSASFIVNPFLSPFSTDCANRERPASPPADLSPPQKLLHSRAYITRPIPTDIEEIQLSSSDVDDPPPMGQEGEEDPLAHVAEGPI